MEQQQQRLLHFCDSKHPLVFDPRFLFGYTCCGCQESIHGPGFYYCGESGCRDKNFRVHHKSCAEVPLGLHHPLHPIHPLILSPYQIDYGKDIQFSNCLLCNESRNQYTYRCFRCDFNLHLTCASLSLTTMEAEFHDHPLTPFLKSFTFTCDICGKERKDMPYLCHLCSFWVHGRCASFPLMVKVVRHKHLLHLTHSSLEFDQPDTRFCQLCVRKVDTRYGLYYCSRCDFVAHLNCAIDSRNKENINVKEFKDVDEVPELNESADSATYEVKKPNMKEDGTQIVEEIKHISHEHDLKLTNEVPNDQICDGCVRAILPPYYSCVNSASGFTYACKECRFYLDVHCSLISDILTHKGHEHPLILSYTTHRQKCSCCSNESEQVFRCSTCEFALDYKCATLPQSARYNQHEHPFTLCYRPEDDSGEYYCDICEEERDSKQWFYYCEDCSYPAHPKCILGEYPNMKFRGA
ncbi:hypothetical protein ACB092_02G018100 [Castanea dentata]